MCQFIKCPHPLDFTFVWLHTNEVNTKQMTFTKSFLNTLLFNLATIAAIVVGVVSYAYRATFDWYANGGREFLIDAAANLAAGVHKLSEKMYYQLEVAADA